jgi:hypothetical protein
LFLEFVLIRILSHGIISEMCIKRKIEFVFVYQYMLLYPFIYLFRNIKDITENITESIVSAYQDTTGLIICTASLDGLLQLVIGSWDDNSFTLSDNGLSFSMLNYVTWVSAKPTIRCGKNVRDTNKKGGHM